MRVETADLRETERLQLELVTPVQVPMGMLIDPGNLCNIKCSFCPTGIPELVKGVGRPMGLMTDTTFDLIVKGLLEFDEKVKIINFYKDGEPLIHPKYIEMSSTLKQSGVCDKLYTKTNGVAFKKDGMIEKTIGVEFDLISISVIAPHAEGYRRIANVGIDYEEFVKNIAKLFSLRNCPIHIKMCDAGFEEWEVQKFLDDFTPICDFIAIEGMHGWSRTELHDFSLGQKSITFDGIKSVPDRIVCTWPLYQMTINWNGAIAPCHEDWSWVNIMGNLHEQSLKNIWLGDKFNTFRRMQLEGKRFKNKACGTCWQVRNCPDDVDKQRLDILSKFPITAS